MSRRLAFALPPRPVESFTQQRAEVRAVEVPEVGLRWGEASDFDFMLPEADKADEDGSGVVLIAPTLRRTVDRISRMSPVWRRYEVWRVGVPDDPAQSVDVTVTREALLPVGEGIQRYVGGGIGYVIDPGRYRTRDRVIHSYVLIKIPAPQFGENAETIDGGTVGDWPDFPEDEWSGNSLAAAIGGTPYGSTGGEWDR